MDLCKIFIGIFRVVMVETDQIAHDPASWYIVFKDLGPVVQS